MKAIKALSAAIIMTCMSAISPSAQADTPSCTGGHVEEYNPWGGYTGDVFFNISDFCTPGVYIVAVDYIDNGGYGSYNEYGGWINAIQGVQETLNITATDGMGFYQQFTVTALYRVN